MIDIQLLNKIKFFSDFTQEEKTEIAKLEGTIFRKFNAKEPIINEGDHGKSFFIVLKGRADVFKKPNVNPIASLGPGAIFGEISFLSPRIRAASVIAIDPCIVLEFGFEIKKNLSFSLWDKLKDKLITLLIKHLDDIIDLRTKDNFSTRKSNPFEEGLRMKGVKQKIQIFSEGGYNIYYLGGMEALLENSVDGTSKKVTMVELSNRIPPKYLKFIKEFRQDPADYLFGRSGEFSGYIVPKAAQHAWKSTINSYRAEQMMQNRSVQIHQTVDNIY